MTSAKWIAVFLLFLVFAVFFPSLSGFFISDDFLLLHRVSGENFKLIDCFSEYLDIPIGNFFRPVPLLFFYLLWNLVGMGPAWYHALLIALHAGNSLLVFVFARTILEGARAEVLAFFASVLFAIHSRVLESVIIVNSLPDLLSVFFALLSLICLDRWDKSNSRAASFCALFTGILALLSKESTVYLIVLAPLFVYVKRRQELQRFGRKVLLVLLWELIVVILYLCLRFLFTGNIWVGTSAFMNWDVIHMSGFLLKAFVAFLVPSAVFGLIGKVWLSVILVVVALGMTASFRKEIALILRASDTRERVAFLLAAALLSLTPASLFDFSISTGQENRFLYTSIAFLSILTIVVGDKLLTSARAKTALVLSMTILFAVLSRLEYGTRGKAFELSQGLFTAFAEINPAYRKLVVLDAPMYYRGLAVVVSADEISLARRGKENNRFDSVKMVSFTSLEHLGLNRVIEWQLEADTLWGTSQEEGTTFTGLVEPDDVGRAFFKKKPYVVQGLEFDQSQKHARKVKIFPVTLLGDSVEFVSCQAGALRVVGF